MDAVHLHLALNHFPVVGFILFTPLFIYALWKRQEVLLRICLVFFFILGILAVVVHTSGENAEEIVEETLEVNHRTIHEHEEWGERAYWFAALCGFASIFIIAMRWQFEAWKRWVYIAVLALSLATSGLMFKAASEGGKIRHTELDDTQAK